MTVVVGDPAIFAIESDISKAVESLGQRALGYFVIHINGRRYGIKSPHASMLACSFDVVQERVASRGRHVAPFATEPALRIVDAYLDARVRSEPVNQALFGMSAAALEDLFISNGLAWAPDGDEAFDDGSCVLQFDVGEKVRLIGFRNCGNFQNVAGTICEVWIDSDAYYDGLAEWLKLFEIDRAFRLVR